MAEFGKALRDADKVVAESPDVGYARTRVWQRIKERRARAPRPWVTRLILSLGAAVPVGVVVLAFLWVGVSGERVAVAPDRAASTAAAEEVSDPSTGSGDPGYAESNADAVPKATGTLAPITTVARPVPPPSVLASATAISPPDDNDDRPGPPTQGKLVAIAIGGQCSFAVDGASKGTASSIQVTVAMGWHTVSCRYEGSTRMQRVKVTDARPGIAKFKLH